MNENVFNELKKKIFIRNPESNKGDLGKALIIGGSPSYPFAPAIASVFATFAGPGYVCLHLPEEVLPLAAGHIPLSCVFSADALKKSDRYSAILFGNGLEDNLTNQKILRDLLTKYAGTLIIDATGLDILKEIGFVGEKRAGRILLTPHPGEAKRLLGIAQLSPDPLSYSQEAQSYVDCHDVSLLLKSYYSVYFSKGQKPVSSTYPPTPCLAHAGSGDALAGLLVGLFARRPDVSFSEVVLFADELFHRAASLYEKEHPLIHEDVSSLLPFLEKALA